jgi:hypothetical protein
MGAGAPPAPLELQLLGELSDLPQDLVSAADGHPHHLQQAFREGSVPSEGCDSQTRDALPWVLDWFERLFGN